MYISCGCPHVVRACLSTWYIKKKRKTRVGQRRRNASPRPSVMCMATAAHEGVGVYYASRPLDRLTVCVCVCVCVCACFIRPKRRQITRATVTAVPENPDTKYVQRRNTTTIIPAGMAVTRHGFEFKVYTEDPHSGFDAALPGGGGPRYTVRGEGSGNSVDGRSSLCFFSLGRVEPVRNCLVVDATHPPQRLRHCSVLPQPVELGDTISRRCTADEAPLPPPPTPIRVDLLLPGRWWLLLIAGKALYNRRAWRCNLPHRNASHRLCRLSAGTHTHLSSSGSPRQC